MSEPGGSDAGGAPDRGVDALIDDATRGPGSRAGIPARAGADGSWWTRNRLPAAALLVMIALCAGFLGSKLWADHLSVRAAEVVPVAADGSIRHAGTEWSIDSVERIPGSDPRIDQDSVAAGVDAVFVRVLVRPAGGQLLCTVQLLERRESGPDRRWSSEPGGLRADYDPERETSCRRDPVGTYTAEFAFQIPASADGDLSLEVVVPDALPEFLRLELD